MGPGRFRFVGAPGNEGSELGFPGEFGGVAEEPVAAAGDGGLDVGDAGDGVFGVLEATSAPVELCDTVGSFLVEMFQVALLGVEPVRGFVDGVLVGPSEAAGS